MLKKLSRTKVEFVKRHYREWYRREKEADAIPLEMDEELLRNFFDFLGFKDSAFVDLPGEVYDIKIYKGSKMIWDFIKKQLFKAEERPVTRQKKSTKKKSSAQKSAPAKTEDKQIEEAPAIVQVEG